MPEMKSRFNMGEFKKIEKKSQSRNFRGYFLKILGDFANSKIFGGIFGGNFSISGAFRGLQGFVAEIAMFNRNSSNLGTT